MYARGSKSAELEREVSHASADSAEALGRKLRPSSYAARSTAFMSATGDSNNVESPVASSYSNGHTLAPSRSQNGTTASKPAPPAADQLQIASTDGADDALSNDTIPAERRASNAAASSRNGSPDRGSSKGPSSGKTVRLIRGPGGRMIRAPPGYVPQGTTAEDEFPQEKRDRGMALLCCPDPFPFNTLCVINWQALHSQICNDPCDNL